MPSGSYADVVARLRPDAAAPGDIVDRDGRRAWAGTTGSRATRSGRAKRLGARGEDRGERQVVVATGARRAAGWWSGRATPARDTVRLREVNWLVPPPEHACAAR